MIVQWGLEKKKDERLVLLLSPNKDIADICETDVWRGDEAEDLVCT